MAPNEIKTKLRKAKKLLREEGLLGAIKRLFSIFFEQGTFYVYEKTIDGAKNSIKKSEFKDYLVKTIHSMEELNDLEEEDYNLDLMNLRKRIKHGALPFCIFSGKALVHITWVAMNETSKKQIDRIPFKVDFQHGEVCSGGSLTDSSYRGRNLLNYAYSYILPYLYKNDFRKVKFSINVNNVASQKAHAKFNPTIIGKGHYLKIFCLNIWKEIDERMK